MKVVGLMDSFEILPLDGATKLDFFLAIFGV